jgi:hypothetical protein
MVKIVREGHIVGNSPIQRWNNIMCPLFNHLSGFAWHVTGNLKK